MDRSKLKTLWNMLMLTVVCLMGLALGLPETNATFVSKKYINENSVDSGFWVKPSVTVLSPNGGEVYEVNEEITIRWEAQSSDPDSSVTSVLYFSDDAGAHYTLISSDLKDIFTYDWSLPSVKSDQMKIKVEVEDDHGLTNSDESDAVFDPVVKDDESEKDSNESKDKDKDGEKNDGVANDLVIAIPTVTLAPTLEPVAPEANPLPDVEEIVPTSEPITEPTIPPVEEALPISEPTVELSEPAEEEPEVIETASSDPEPEPENSQDTSSAPDEEVQDVVQ
jgi:hypothetical protein